MASRIWQAWQALRGQAYQEQPIQGEIALADPYKLFGGTEAFEAYNPSILVSRKGLRIYDAMRIDDQIKASLAFKKHAVLATGWAVQPPAEGGIRETELIDKMLTEMVGTMNNALLQILTSVDYGYSITEKLWSDSSGGAALTVTQLKTKAPEPFEFIIDGFGNQIALKQQGNPLPQLPIEKFVIHQYQKEFGNPYGRSDLEAAYRAWWTKDNAYKWLGMLLERYGIPPIFALYNSDKYKGDAINALKRVFETLQARSSGVIPRGATKEDLELWSPELAGQANTVFIPAFAMMNQDIARAILMPGMLGVTPDQVGSFARAKVIFDVFMFVVEALRKDIAEAVNEQIVRPVVDLNFTSDNYPTFEFLPLTDEQEYQLLKTWTEMVTAGVVGTQDSDEDHIRERLEFPPRDEDREEEPPPPAEDEGGEDTAGEDLEDGEDDDDDDQRDMARVDSLYVSRPLVNTEDFIAWAKAQGFPTTMPADDLHVTVLYSKDGFDDQTEPAADEVVIEGGARGVEALGDDGAVVLTFESAELQERNQAFRDSGASATFADFKPHTTITYRENEIDLDLSSVEPYEGPLIFGPEKRRAISKTFDPDAKRATELAAVVPAGAIPKDQTIDKRAETEAERQVDFRQMRSTLDDFEATALEALQKRFVVARDDMLRQLKKKLPTPTQVSNLKFFGLEQLKGDTRRMLTTAFNGGRETLRDEVPRETQTAAGDPVTFQPRDALDWLRQKAIIIADVMSERVLADAKESLLTSLSVGETTQQASARIRDVFLPWIGNPQVIRGDAPVQPSRLENIVRTNTTDSFNKGRVTEARRPQYEGIITGMQYSAIIDTRTTEVCRYLDTRVFRMDDPNLENLTPPNHFMCRSVLVPITVGIPIDESDIVDRQTAGRAEELAGKGFT